MLAEPLFSITSGGLSRKKEVNLIEIEDGMMTGFEIKRKEGKRAGAPASFTAAYPDARFECVTPSDPMSFLM